MSHSCVLVIGKDFEDWKEQLGPFQEEGSGDVPPQYLEFHDMEDEYRKEYETEGVEMVELSNGKRLYPWDDAFRISGTLGTGTGTHKDPEGAKRIQVPYRERYETFEKFCSDWHSGKRDPDKKRYGYRRPGGTGTCSAGDTPDGS